ncbi:polymorphic toxin type 44 domain-containing protein [Gordonia amicalis]|uniref:polymorphic toxin type 44 domain-containing protein n=1 Tax=Gordonia amicalis TaxID=89053 RepID=UPI0002A62A7B|nr:polymorphic toxin type 44 domain-containing protein [Gordonia amicalis]NKX79196.1 hypothetical protein [Gordonia amicalis]UKO93672.1 polymorphic toxin type 44 domain-containing protein [Gordonia amicalis]GAC53959.1 hypothetical protein GOAMI_26_00070 [Gordonia amicalis NBRC 100051 = JCM 11271]
MKIEFEGIANSTTNPSERRFNEILRWMYEEFMRNAHSDRVAAMKRNNDYADGMAELAANPKHWWHWFADFGCGTDARNTAFASWFERVATGRPWDHKPFIRKEWGVAEGDYDGDLNFEEPGTGRSVYYDMWSNMHYGYVGRAAGFDGQTLLDAQNLPVPGVGGTSRGDDIATSWGVEMWERYGDDMTEDEFATGVTEMIDQMAREKSVAPDTTPDINLKYGTP